MSDIEQKDINPNKHPDPFVWWKHRRRHSYISLLGLFLLANSAIIIDATTLTAVSPLFQTIAWIFGMIIFTYIMAATAEDIAKIKK